jgi:putative nucleotidyltransferase with HDIG domain
MSELVERAKSEAIHLIVSCNDGRYVYHDLQHTIEVAETAEHIALEMGIQGEVFEALLVAAWFHDTGYFEDISKHEEISARIAAEFLREHNASPEFIGEVTSYILATNISKDPTTVGERLMRDADVHYIGTDRFPRCAANLRLEWELTEHRFFSDSEWLELNIRFLESQNFFTPVAHHRWERGKQGNLSYLRGQRPL